jgi:hypothetical protein
VLEQIGRFCVKEMTCSVSKAQAMTTPPEEYRTRAAECLRSAPTMLDSLARDTLVHMAAHWARLADFHEASRNLQDIQQVVVGATGGAAHASG